MTQSDPTDTALALKAVWKDGHRAGLGCGHDLAVCRHDDYAVAVELIDLASWNKAVAALVEGAPDDPK